ncbi:hypothetical protein P9112_009056 [Eukaryota sp. TZLM1-RC]
MTVRLPLPVRFMKSWTRACSLHQFFERPVCDYIEGQLTKVTTMAHLGNLLARVFAVRFPKDSHFLTQHQFWSQCLDFVAVTEAIVRHPFNRPDKCHVYESSNEFQHHGRRNFALRTSGPLQQLVDAKCRQLQGNYQQLLADGLVSWKLNFFRSYAVGHNCPAPATYAGFVLHSSTNFQEPLLSWINTHHTMAVTLFNFLVGYPQRYNTLLSSRRVTLNQGNSTYIFRCGLTIKNYLEQAFAHTFRRHRLTHIASLKLAFVPFST